MEKLVMNTFILGTALPSTAKDMLIIKFKAIKGAAMRVPIIKTFETSLAYSTIGLAERK
jgi:hypothetical protein